MKQKRVSRNFRGFFLATVWIVLFAGVVGGATYTHDQGVPQQQLAGDTVRVDVGDGHGSGVHIGRGYILTAAHVTSHGADKITVVLDNGDEFDAEVLWTNKDYDVALLRIEHAELKSAELSCRMPVVGEPIEVVGNPVGLKNIHTWGKVAGTVASDEVTKGPMFIGDVTIAPGNSGGPVFDAGHKVIGIADAVPQTGMFEQQINGLGIFVPGETICELLGRE